MIFTHFCCFVALSRSKKSYYYVIIVKSLLFIHHPDLHQKLDLAQLEQDENVTMIQGAPSHCLVFPRTCLIRLRLLHSLTFPTDPSDIFRQGTLSLIQSSRLKSIRQSQRFYQDSYDNSTEQSSWLVYNLSQDFYNSKHKNQLKSWARNLQDSDSPKQKSALYFNLIRALVKYDKSNQIPDCDKFLWQAQVIPSKEEWAIFLQEILKNGSESTSEMIFKVFKQLPQNYKDYLFISGIEWMESNWSTHVSYERWLYRLALNSRAKPSKRVLRRFKRLIPFKTSSKVLSDPAFFREFLRLLQTGNFRKIPQELAYEFLQVSEKMSKPNASIMVERIIDSIYRFDIENQQQILNYTFWQMLIQSHKEIPHEKIIKLMQRSGLKVKREIFEEFILRNEDFEECNALCDLFFQSKFGAQQKPTDNMQQFSIRVYSHMIRLLCNYSPADAREVFNHPSVRSSPDLVIGYLLGLIEGRDYPAVISAYRLLEKDGLVTSKIWNMYVHALTKDGQTELAAKLATESMITHSPTKISVTPAFISNSLNSFANKKNDNKVLNPIPAKQELTTSTSTIKFAPIYIPTPRSIPKAPTKVESWLPQDSQLQECAYLLDNQAFSKVALAMMHYERSPARQQYARKYLYGEQELTQDDVNLGSFSPSNSSITPVKSKKKFSMTQIIHFLRLGWHMNNKSKVRDSVTVSEPGYQLHPGSISLILRDIQRGHLQITQQEFIAFIRALVELYPSEKSCNFKSSNTAFFQADIFTSSFISRIIFIGYLKSPRIPWVSVELLRDLQTQHGVEIDVKSVRDALLSALSIVYGIEPVGGELRRVRHQMERTATVHEVAESFNLSWMGHEINKLDNLNTLIDPSGQKCSK